MEENDNIVPEPSVTNSSFGAPSLDPDRLTDDVHASIDAALDQAEAETQPEQQLIRHSESYNENNYERITETNNSNTPQPAPDPASQVEEQVSTTNVQTDSANLTGDVSGHSLNGTEAKQIEIDPEILSIEQPRNLSEKNQNNWRKLQETATTYKQEAQALKQQLQQSAQQAIPPDYEELKTFRKIFDIKNDPEFRSKYAEPIQNAHNNIIGIMKQNGASDELIAGIEKAGGIDKIDKDWFAQNILNKLPFDDKKMMEDDYVALKKLKQQQEGEIKNAAENGEKILAEKETQAKNWFQNENTAIRDYVEEITKQAPWARYQEIPENATQDQIEKIQQHNQNVQKLETKFNSALWPQTAQQRASIAAAAVLSDKLTGDVQSLESKLATLDAQLKKVTEENNRLKGASRMPKQNVQTPNKSKNYSVNDRIKMNASDAIDLGLDEAGL